MIYETGESPRVGDIIKDWDGDKHEVLEIKKKENNKIVLDVKCIVPDDNSITCAGQEFSFNYASIKSCLLISRIFLKSVEQLSMFQEVL